MACLSQNFYQLVSTGIQAFLLIFRSGCEDGCFEIFEDGEGKRHSPTPGRHFRISKISSATEVSYILPLSRFGGNREMSSDPSFGNLGSADLIVILFCDKHNEVSLEKGDENGKLFKEPAGARIASLCRKTRFFD